MTIKKNVKVNQRSKVRYYPDANTNDNGVEFNALLSIEFEAEYLTEEIEDTNAIMTQQRFRGIEPMTVTLELSDPQAADLAVLARPHEWTKIVISQASSIQQGPNAESVIDNITLYTVGMNVEFSLEKSVTEISLELALKRVVWYTGTREHLIIGHDTFRLDGVSQLIPL